MVNKCCYFFPPQIGAMLLGFFTLIISMVLGIYALVVLCMEHVSPPRGTDHLRLQMHLELEPSAVKIVLTIVVTVQLLWMLFSAMLIYGLRKNRPCFLLCYFSFGVVVAIFMMVGGLLVLLQKHWILSLSQFISAAIYLHGLVIVYHTYEEMQNGKVFNERSEDETQLWNPVEESTELSPS